MKFSDWINPKYINYIKNQELPESILRFNPFRMAVFKNFLQPEVIQAISKRSELIKTSPAIQNIGVARRANAEWGAYADPEVLRFFCGKEFLNLLKLALGSQYRLRRNWTPQLAHFHPQSGGFDCHNDLDEPRDAVTLLYLTPNYPEDGGGELQFHNSQREVVDIIQPRMNTLILFEVSDQSWHSIKDMNGNWVRRNVLFDWEKVC